MRYSLQEIQDQNHRIPDSTKYRHPKEELLNLPAWKVTQNTTFPNVTIFDDVIGFVGVEIARRNLKGQVEVLLYFPVKKSWGRIRSFLIRDLEEIILY